MVDVVLGGMVVVVVDGAAVVVVGATVVVVDVDAVVTGLRVVVPPHATIAIVSAMSAGPVRMCPILARINEVCGLRRRCVVHATRHAGHQPSGVAVRDGGG